MSAFQPFSEFIRTGWTWWLTEVQGLLETVLGWKIGARRFPSARIFPDGNCVLSSPSEGSPASKATVRKVAVELPPEWVIRTRVDLPLAAASRAREAIGFMIDRLSPFQRDQVFFAVQVVGFDRERRVAHTEIAITPRVRVQSALARLVEQGFSPARVEASTADLPHPFVFDGAGINGASSRVDRFSSWIAVATFITVALCAPGLVLETEWRAQTLEDEAQAQRPAAERARTLSNEIAQNRKSQQEWRAFAEAPRVSEILETLTERVDDSAWVFSLEYSREGVMLHGLAHDVPALLKRLSTPPFGTGAITGAIVSGGTHDGDRFDAKLPILEIAR